MNDDDPGEPLALPAIPGLDRFEPVARGGMGIILKARDTALDRPVAVKVLARSWHVSDADRNRAEREAMLLARLVRYLVSLSTTAQRPATTPWSPQSMHMDCPCARQPAPRP